MNIKSRPIVLIVLAVIILGFAYSIITPLFEASDEQWHYPMVKYIADHGFGLPLQDSIATQQTMWRQEGGQPPLYYYMGAALTFWIDTSDLPTVRRVNPHADIGIIVPDGNANMMIHDPTVESFPWHGTVLAVHLIRFMSVLMGAVTVYMTYLLTLELFPNRRGIALTAALFVALNPMFLFISGSVNNDNLSNMLASILLVMIIRLAKRKDAPSMRDLVLIGITAGAAMLAKFNIGFLLPFIALSLAINAYRLRRLRPFIVGALVTGGLTILIAGWWYIRNETLYGDPTGLNVFLDIVGRRHIPASLAQLWSERTTFLMSYWGFFGGVNVPLPAVSYLVFNGIALLAVIGLVIAVILFLRKAAQPPNPNPSPLYGGKGDLVGGDILIGRLFTVIWIVVLFVSLLRWTSETWASQGRLMFSAIAALSMWMAVGLFSIPTRLKWVILAVVLLHFASDAVIVAPSTIYQTYTNPHYAVQPPQYGDENTEARRQITFADPGQPAQSIDMAAYSFSGSVMVGNYLNFAEYFHLDPNTHFDRDWTVFIHLINSQGVIVAQRDVFLGQGQWATSLLKTVNNEPKDWWNNFAVFIPDNAVAPQELNVCMGLYDASGQRMKVDLAVQVIDNSACIGKVDLLPHASTLNVPNPTSVNFGGEAEFIGYDISKLVAVPGDPVKVTLYWRALHPITTDYRVLVQLLEPDTTHTFGQDDFAARRWSRPTTSWKPGEIIKDEHTFKINPDAPPGTWQLQIAMYQLTTDETGANQFSRLPIINPDGGATDDTLFLTRMKIDPPEEF